MTRLRRWLLAALTRRETPEQRDRRIWVRRVMRRA